MDGRASRSRTGESGSPGRVRVCAPGSRVGIGADRARGRPRDRSECKALGQGFCESILWPAVLRGIPSRSKARSLIERRGGSTSRYHVGYRGVRCSALLVPLLGLPDHALADHHRNWQVPITRSRLNDVSRLTTLDPCHTLVFFFLFSRARGGGNRFEKDPSYQTSRRLEDRLRSDEHPQRTTDRGRRHHLASL